MNTGCRADGFPPCAFFKTVINDERLVISNAPTVTAFGVN